MAHGDYSCCAICDCKLEYGSERTKEDLCICCLMDLRSNGVNVLSVEELLAWMSKESAEEVIRVLKACGHCFCHFPNKVDDFVKTLMKNAETNP